MSKKIQVIPCVDWFYVGTDENDGDIIARVAAWALYDDGAVVGLVAQSVEDWAQGISQLDLPPAFPGTYIHETLLTPEQRVRMGIPKK